MAKFGLDINVKSEGRKGVTGGLGATRRSDVREGMQQARETKKALIKKDTRDPSVRTNRQLVTTIQRLDRSVVKLTKSVESLSGNVRTAARRGGLGGGRGGGGLGFRGGGGGVGRMGGALPIVGAVIGAFGFALSKVMQLGRASMAKVLEQRGSAGVGGFQRSGGYTGVFSAAEFSQYLKERRMAAGRFDTATGQDAYQGGDINRAPMSVRATAIYGTGAEFARTAGLMDISARMRGRTGEQDFSEVIRRTFRGRGAGTTGIGTELPILLREVTTNMEEAVRDGVDASNVAKDMATELTSIARVTPGGQIRSATQIQRSMIDIQRQASRGQGGVGAWRMNMAARSLLMNQGQQGQRVRERLQQTGMITQAQIRTLSEGRQLPPEQMQFLVQALQGQQAGEVRTSFARDIVTQLGGTGDREEQLARFHRVAQTMMPGLNLTPQRSAQLFDHARRQEAAERYDTLRNERTQLEAQYQGVTGRSATVTDVANVGRSGGRANDILQRMQAIDREMQQRITTRNTQGQLVTQTLEQMGTDPSARVSTQRDAENRINTQMQRGGAVRGVQAQMGLRESLLLGRTAAAARRAVVTVETSFVDLARQLSGPVTTGITAFNNAVVSVSSTATEAMNGISGLIEEVREAGGLGNYIRNAINPFN